MIEWLIRLAGVGLLLIVLANFLVGGRFRYRENLAKCDRFFGQIFRVHAAYIVFTIAGMGALCLWRPQFFLETAEGRAVAGFIAIFWLSRVILQFFYYDRAFTGRYPFWNIFFATAFGALGVLFGGICLLS